MYAFVVNCLDRSVMTMSNACDPIYYIYSPVCMTSCSCTHLSAHIYLFDLMTGIAIDLMTSVDMLLLQ